MGLPFFGPQLLGFEGAHQMSRACRLAGLSRVPVEPDADPVAMAPGGNEKFDRSSV
jgi:hypothetical protein